MMGSAGLSGVAAQRFDNEASEPPAKHPLRFSLSGLFSLFGMLSPAQAAPRAIPGGLGDILDELPYGMARWSEDGELIAANAPFARLLRLTDIAVAPGLSYSAVSRRLRGKISTRPVLDGSCQRLVEIERADGTTVLLDERPCAGAGFLTLVTDITERRSADRMLGAMRDEQRQLARRYHEEKIRAEAASRAKTAFLAHLSHDIRTPLNHIIGFADLIGLETYGPLGDDKYRAYVEDIRTSGQRLLASFGEILEFAELEGGRKTLACAPVAIDALLAETLARFRDTAERAGIDLSLAETARRFLYADRHCLDRMLGNLLDNALRFTPRGGRVRIGAWEAEDGVVLAISDTGIGISEEQLSRLSQPFALGDPTFTKTHDGTGLGIAIARTIAELSGGRLAIDSMAAVGTTVAISLPLAPADLVPADKTAARAAA